MNPAVKRIVSLVIGILLIILGWLFSDHKGGPAGSANAPATTASNQNQPVSSGSKPDPAPKAAPQTPVTKPASGTDRPLGTGFDFYVVSLSWSPTWCATSPDADSARQCARQLGLVMHGFWPQNEHGYPEFCATSEPDRVPETLARAYLDLIPSIGLIGHEWRKHGTCSGLSQEDYLAAARLAGNAINIPKTLLPGKSPSSMMVDDLERDFVNANSGLQKAGIAVTCKNNMLEEVRICMTRDLKFRTCPDVDRNSCRISSVSIPQP